MALLHLREPFAGLQLATRLPYMGLGASRMGQDPQTRRGPGSPAHAVPLCVSECASLGEPPFFFLMLSSLVCACFFWPVSHKIQIVSFQ